LDRRRRATRPTGLHSLECSRAVTNACRPTEMAPGAGSPISAIVAARERRELSTTTARAAGR